MSKKVSIVTGAAQGIGSVIAQYFNQSGFISIAVDNDADAVREFQKKNPEIFCLFADVSDEEQVRNLIQSVVEKHHQIDCIVNNAGIGVFKPLENVSLEEWNLVMSTNVGSVFLLSKYAIPFLRKTKGNIINMASTRASMSEANTESYTASKGAIVALTHAMAISLGPEVKVNSISPGWIDTSDHKKGSVQMAEQLSETDHKQHPVGRVGKPQDVANMVLFIANQDDSFITGQDFVIDGGMTKKMIYL